MSTLRKAAPNRFALSANLVVTCLGGGSPQPRQNLYVSPTLVAPQRAKRPKKQCEGVQRLQQFSLTTNGRNGLGAFFLVAWARGAWRAFGRRALATPLAKGIPHVVLRGTFGADRLGRSRSHKNLYTRACRCSTQHRKAVLVTGLVHPFDGGDGSEYSVSKHSHLSTCHIRRI